MADPLAKVTDYAEQTMEDCSGAKAMQVAALLEQASELVRAVVADLDARIAAGTLPAALATGVCVRVVQRFLANPTQASQLTKGPFSVAYAAANARGLYVTAEDVGGLLPAPPAGTARGVGTIRAGLPVGTVRHGPRFRPW